jgi:hypothetical protein
MQVSPFAVSDNVLIVFSVLDNRVTYQGLTQTYADERDLLHDIIASRSAFESRLLVHYSPPTTSDTTSSHPPTSSASPSVAGGPASRWFARFAKAKQDHSSSCQQSAWMDSVRAELDRFFALETEDYPTADDPVKWWARHRDQFPNIARMARDILAIPGEHETLLVLVSRITDRCLRRLRCIGRARF